MSKEDVKRGPAQFQQNCSFCHGTAAKGGSGPSLIASSLVRHDENGNLIEKVVKEGRPDRGMPAFPSLAASQVSDIVAFLHARIEVSDVRSAVIPAGGYSLQRLLTGNAGAGKQYFDSKCASCHSPTKDLVGVAKKYSPVELETRILYPRIDTQTATISLPSGEKVKGQVMHLDAFYVAILDTSGNYRSWARNANLKVDVDDPLHGHYDLLKTYTDKDIHDVFAYLETLR
jgi:cytochrome c oxidase cbb3-type subunit 3